MISKLLGEYINGNYSVKIYDDGTKIRDTESNMFDSSFPESIDLKITNWCNIGCSFCHECSSIHGKHGDILNLKFIDSLRPFTELAIGGGDPMSHPQLIQFLCMLKQRDIIANLTVHSSTFNLRKDTIDYLIRNDLIKGLGVSVSKVSNELLSTIKGYKNLVVHVVNGVISIEEFRKLYDNNIKVLVLGYKTYGRGLGFYCENIEETRKNKSDMLEEIPKSFNHLSVISFDNLALKQLNVRGMLSEDIWEDRFMGHDGLYTMYIDAVERKFAKSSTSELRYDISDHVIDRMFTEVKREAVKELTDNQIV